MLNHLVNQLGVWLVHLDWWLQEKLHLPEWVSLVGLTEHVIVGRILRWAIDPVCSSWGVKWVVLILAFIHEQAQGNFSDFRKPKPGQPPNGAPYNGLMDVAAFVLGAW